jgi:hypothetical protein
MSKKNVEEKHVEATLIEKKMSKQLWSKKKISIV